ncbi:hypothetical protein N8700_00595 [Candidatus Pelagibacter sp.]|nr:hypothetical protein [Candidatus Pelagibacter sp.]|tara:strand:+ start:3676 stop:4182 length:507 start_codon:yes stop_codon:yes gene_type:complete
MKTFKFFLILIVFSLLTKNAYADCFVNTNFGDDLRETDRKNLGPIIPSRYKKNTVNIYLNPLTHCPEQNLGRSLISLKFNNEKLYSKTIEVVNLSKKNLESNKKLLFDYVIRNYGSFEGSNNINDYDGFNHWKKGDIDIVYSKELDLKGIIKEELTIYNNKYKSTTDD